MLEILYCFREVMGLGLLLRWFIRVIVVVRRPRYEDPDITTIISQSRRFRFSASELAWCDWACRSGMQWFYHRSRRQWAQYCEVVHFLWMGRCHSFRGYCSPDIPALAQLLSVPTHVASFKNNMNGVFISLDRTLWTSCPRSVLHIGPVLECETNCLLEDC